MIHVIGKYGIEVSDKCYVAGKVGKQIDKKTSAEVEYIQSPAYCTSVQNALNVIRKRMQMDALRNTDCDLETATNKIRALDECFEQMIKKIKF